MRAMFAIHNIQFMDCYLPIFATVYVCVCVHCSAGCELEPDPLVPIRALGIPELGSRRLPPREAVAVGWSSVLPYVCSGSPDGVVRGVRVTDGRTPGHRSGYELRNELGACLGHIACLFLSFGIDLFQRYGRLGVQRGLRRRNKAHLGRTSPRPCQGEPRHGRGN
jgi:hypothetical protein